MEKKLNFAAKITKTFLYNKPLTILVIVGIFFAGFLSYFLTPKQYNPKITLPAFEVSVDFKGASAIEVENFVTKELEEKIAEIPGVDEISSKSIDGGKSIVNVLFHIGENLEDSKVKLESKLSGNNDLRISGMGNPLIKTINPDNVPIFTIGLTSEKFSQNELRQFATGFSDYFRKIEGIANIEIKGGEKKALRVFLDPALMKFFSVSIKDVEKAILANNLKVNSGFLKNGKNLREIEVNGNLTKEDAENLIVIPGIKLGSFAKIEDGFSEKTSFINISKNGKKDDLVILSFAKREGENASTISNKIIEILEKEKNKEEYNGINFEILRNDGEVAQKAILGLGLNLIQSIIIVSIVLFAFLGWRPALLVAFAIPMTLGLVFLSGLLLDQTINRITLFALILSLGLLVDSATVIMENIYRHIQLHEDKRKAIIHAVDEVGIGLFLSTLTSVIVFLPTSQISGMMGAYMGPLSIFVPLALIMSLFVAYVVIPFLALIFLPTDKEMGKDVFGKGHKKSFFDKISDNYSEILEKILDSKKLQKKILFFVFGGLFISFLIPVFGLTHFKMLPTADKNQFYVYIDASNGTDLPALNSFVKDFNNLILKDKNIKNIQSFIGDSSVVDFNGLFKGSHLRVGDNLATLRINLIDKNNRGIKSEEIVNNLRKIIKKEISSGEKYNLENFTIRFVQDPPGPPVQATLLAKVKGENSKIREKIAKDLEENFKNTELVVDVDTSIEESFFKTVFKIDSEKALKSGLSTIQISNALSLLHPISISQFHSNSKEISLIELQFPKNLRDNFSDISQIYLKNQGGKMIPLESVVKKIETRNQPVIYRDGFENVSYVSAELGDRSVVYAVINLIGDILNYEKYGLKLDSWNLYGFNFSNEKGEEFKIEWGGEFEMTLDNFKDLSIAMLVAFILIYFILVAQFRSFGAPGLIMATIPLGLVGILFGFLFLDFFGIYLTATALIGFIALMGIVVNNAIIYLEYFDILIEEKGYKIKDALIESGKTRLRPILLTSMTTVLGLLTIVGDPVWSGLAWAIVFGLSVSSLLTLGVFPILYYLVKPERG